MFERFTRTARAVVVGAQREAEREGAGEISPVHLLPALLADPTDVAAAVLAEHGVTADTVAEDLRRTRRRAGLSDEDAAALERLGIDVENIVERVEQTHGEYALAGGGRPKRRRLFGVLDHRPFTSQAKQVLEQSLREAIDLGDRHIGTEHLMLGLLQQPGPASDLLAARGVDYPTARRDMTRRAAAG